MTDVVELVALGRCPECQQPRYRMRTCTCTHPMTAHSFGKRGGVSVRTYCNSYECDCKIFAEKVEP